MFVQFNVIVYSCYSFMAVLFFQRACLTTQFKGLFATRSTIHSGLCYLLVKVNLRRAQLILEVPSSLS